MATIATLIVRLMGEDSTLSSTMGKATQDVKKQAEAMQSFGKSLTAGVTLPILGLGAAAIKGAADQEQLQIAFTTMLGSAEKANKLIQDLQKFSAETPFEMPEVVTAGKQLLAFGIEADKVQSTLRMLGDVGAGVGAPLGDLAYLFGTASASGRLMTADINQFANRGIPIIESLAAVMGVSKNAIRDMAAEGKIGTAEMTKAFEYMTGEGGKFNNMMAAQSRSIYGMASTLKDNLGIALTEIGKKLIEVFNLGGEGGVMAKMLDMTEKIKNSILGFAESNPELFKLVIYFGLAAAAIGPLLVGLGWLAGLFAPGGLLLAGVEAFGAALAFLTGPIGLTIAGVSLLAYAIYQNWGGLGDFVSGMWNRITASMKFVPDATQELISHFITFDDSAYDTTEGIENFLTSLGLSVDSAIAVGQWITDLSMNLYSLGQYFRGVLEDGDYLNDWLTHLPDSIRPAVEWLGRLTAATTDLINGNDFATLKENITTTFSDIGTAISDYFSGDISLGGLASVVSQGFTDITSSISTFFSGQDFGKFLDTIQWDDFVTKLDGWSTYVQMLAWDSYVSALDWASYVGSIAWETVVTKFGEWSTYVKELPWGDYITKLADWSTYVKELPWGDYITKLADWGAYIGEFYWNAYAKEIEWGQYVAKLYWDNYVTRLGDWSAYIVSLPWASYVERLGSWSTYITNLAWDTVISTLSDWGAYISAIDWTAGIITVLDWATWIPALLWNAFVTIIDWALYLGTLDWSTVITKLTNWNTYISVLTNWGSFISVLVWASFLPAIFDWSSYIGELAWMNYVKAMEWGNYIKAITWANFIDKLKWPSIPGVSWSDFISKLSWPSIPSFPGWGAFVNAINPFGSSDNNALGADSYRGGWSWVGEAGPELVYLPTGTNVRSASESRRMARYGDGGVTIQAVYVNDQVDAVKMAYEISDIQARRASR